MSCCCQKIYKFCKVIDACSAADFGDMFKDLSSADYTVELDFLDSVLRLPITVLDGVIDISPLTLNKLNEGYTYVGRVVDVNGATVSIVVDAIAYDCFQFETKFKF